MVNFITDLNQLKLSHKLLESRGLSTSYILRDVNWSILSCYNSKKYKKCSKK
jgi:hypothetical protein